MRHRPRATGLRFGHRHNWGRLKPALAAAGIAALTLSACGQKPSEPGAPTAEAESQNDNSIPPSWKKFESKDAFTDKVTKLYVVSSNESSEHTFTVGCSKSGFLNFYVDYPAMSGIPSSDMEVSVRIDSAPVFTEKWFVSWVSGETRVENPQAFAEKLSGHTKLAIEIMAATRNSYDITGIANVIADMRATACDYEPVKPPEAATEQEEEPSDSTDEESQ